MARTGSKHGAGKSLLKRLDTEKRRQKQLDERERQRKKTTKPPLQS